MNKLLIPATAALLGACAGGPPPFSAEGSAVAIPDGVHVGKLAAVPQVLLEDSRCPLNVQCVWAGRVVLSTRIYGPDFDETVPLVLGEPYETHGTSITLVSVQPQKVAGEDLPAPDYHFGFAGGE